MAILKYDQVTAPDFRGVGDILTNASVAFKRATDSADTLFKDINASRQDMAEYQLRSRLNQLSPEQYLEAGRNFLIDPNNKKYLDRLSLNNYNTLATDVGKARETLLNKYASNTYNKLRDLVTTEGYLDIPSLLSEAKYQQMYDNLPPEVKASLNKLDPTLYGYRGHLNYDPQTHDTLFNKVITSKEEDPKNIKESSNDPNKLANTSKVNDQLTKALTGSTQKIPEELTKEFSAEDLAAANQFLDFYKDDIKSINDLPSRKFLTNRLGLVGDPNPIKYNENAYRAAQAILKNRETENKRNIASSIAKIDKFDYSINSPQLLSIAQEISKVNPEQGKLLTEYVSYDPKGNSIGVSYRKNNIDNIIQSYSKNVNTTTNTNTSTTPSSNKSSQILSETATAIPTNVSNSSTTPKEVDFEAISGATKLRESGKAGMKAVGYDKKGGRSYGDFQINSNMMPAFVKSLKDKYPEVYNDLKDIYYWNNDTAEYRWKKLVSDPNKAKILSDAQKDFAKEQYWDIPLKQLTPDQRDIILSDPGLQMAVYDAAVNGGASMDSPVGVYKVFNKAFEGANSTGEIIRRIGEIRSTGGFTGHSEAIQKGGKNRVNSITEESLKLSKNIPISGGKLVSTPTSVPTSTPKINTAISKETPSINISEEAKQRTNIQTPEVNEVTLNAQELLSPNSKASNFIHKAATEASNNLTSAKQKFYRKLGKIGLSEKQLDEIFEYDQLPQAEQVNKATNSIMDTLVTKEYLKENNVDASELKAKIARIIANGVSKGIPPKVTELALLKSSSENTISQFITGNDFDVEDIDFDKVFPDGINKFIDDYNSAKQNIKNLENAKTILANSVKEVQNLQANYEKYKNKKNLTGQAKNMINRADNLLRRFVNITTPEVDEITKGNIYSY